MADFDGASLSDPERTFLRALNALGVRYLIVGMSAALLQEARGATEDIELWFETLGDPLANAIVHRAKKSAVRLSQRVPGWVGACGVAEGAWRRSTELRILTVCVFANFRTPTSISSRPRVGAPEDGRHAASRVTARHLIDVVDVCDGLLHYVARVSKRSEAQAVLERIKRAASTMRIEYDEHAKKRMAQRRVTSWDVEHALVHARAIRASDLDHVSDWTVQGSDADGDDLELGVRLRLAGNVYVITIY